MTARSPLFKALLATGLMSLASAASAAEIRINNLDAGTGKGLDDPTPTAPIGGNPGTTRGEQARIAFDYAASIWSAVLKSGVPIEINATFQKLACTATSGTLGSSRALSILAFSPTNLPAGAKPDVWYHVALANTLVGEDANPAGADVQMQFNGAMGTPGCLEGMGWYFGLDGNTPAGQSNFLNVMLHEMAHGLGFSAFNNLATGKPLMGSDGVARPDIYSSYVYDNGKGMKWYDMSDAERVTSALNDGHLVFTGQRVKADAPLALGTREALQVSAPQAVAGEYFYGRAQFGPTVSPANFHGAVVRVVTGANAEGCTAFDNAAAIAGHIALVDRGTCAFAIKARFAEAAGASGMLIANNQGGTDLITPSGDGGAPIGIPVIAVSQNDGNAFKANLAGLTIALNTVPAGMDAAGNVQIYAPKVLATGSSFSHFDTRLSPNALMEYAESPDLKGHIDVDLTPSLFLDEGWRVNGGNQLLLTCDTGVPAWLPGGTIIGSNIAAQAKMLASTSATVGDYAAAIRAHVAKLASDGLLTAPQASSVDLCLSDAQIARQYENWRKGGTHSPAVVDMANGQTLTGQAGAAGSERLYMLVVPTNARALNIRTFGGTGDVSLYVKAGDEPSASSYDYQSVHAGNSEAVVAARPAAGTYFIKVVGTKAYAGVSVQATYSP